MADDNTPSVSARRFTEQVIVTLTPGQRALVRLVAEQLEREERTQQDWLRSIIVSAAVARLAPDTPIPHPKPPTPLSNRTEDESAAA